MALLPMSMALTSDDLFLCDPGFDVVIVSVLIYDVKWWSSGKGKANLLLSKENELNSNFDL